MPKKIIICSKRSIKIHKEYGFDEKKIIYIGNGYDLNKYRPNAIQKLQFRKKFNLKNNLPILGNVARYHPQKDHENLLKALSFLKKERFLFKCVLVGKNINKKNKILLNIVKNLNSKMKLFF